MRSGQDTQLLLFRGGRCQQQPTIAVLDAFQYLLQLSRRYLASASPSV